MPMADNDLGSSAYVVLGLTLQQGQVTPYELKQRIATSVGYFWSYSHPQIYQVTKKLTNLGCLKVTQENTGRRRKLYRVTAKGKKAFEAWLARETDSHTELRDLALLKLYFGEYADRTTLERLATVQKAAHEARLKIYREIPTERRLDEYALMTIDLGIQFESQAVKFWERAAKKLRPD